MKTTRALRELGQSIWLDNITRQLLDSGTLQRYIDELDVTGLTSNPTIFDKAIGASDTYDDQIAEAARAGKSHEDTFFELAITDLRRAADLFRPTYERTNGVDGYVSLEVSPLIAYDTETTTSEAKRLSALGDRPNLYIKIPGTRRGQSRRSRPRSSPASRSTSRSCSRRARPWHPPRRTRGASSAASRPACRPRWSRSRRCS